MSAASDSLLALREEALDGLRMEEADWIGRLRDDALDCFREQGIPTRRLEDWKGTNLAPLEAMTFDRFGTSEPNPVVVAGDGLPSLHFVDGRLETLSSEAANLPPGVRLLSLSEARRQTPELLEGQLGQLASSKRNALVALQTAFLDDGAVLVIDADIELDSPILISFTTSTDASGSTGASFPRLLVLAGERSRARIAFDHATESIAPSEAETPSSDSTSSDPAGLTAFVAELYLAAGAHIESVQVQREAAGHIHFTSTHARVENDARFDSHVFSLSRGLVRSELEVTLAGPGASTKMRGFYLGLGRGHVDHFTTVDHSAPSCSSDEEYRGVMGDDSNGVFRGRVIVRPYAQKTDARQSNPNLLISDRAAIDSKPQLEIYADDVKASHGSTTGQLDEDALFFLRARGIDQSKARRLLTGAFARTIVDSIGDERLRATISDQVEGALASIGNDPLPSSKPSSSSKDASESPR